jgi:hypothetical protein
MMSGPVSGRTGQDIPLKGGMSVSELSVFRKPWGKLDTADFVRICPQMSDVRAHKKTDHGYRQRRH